MTVTPPSIILSSMANRRTESSKNRKIDEDSDFDQDFDPSQESVPSEGEQQRKYASDCVYDPSSHRLYTSVWKNFSADYFFTVYIRLIAALKGELIKYRQLNFVGAINIATGTESRKKEKAEKEKKSVKEKKFLQVAEKHLDGDVHNAHICSAFTIANPRIAFFFASLRRRLI